MRVRTGRFGKLRLRSEPGKPQPINVAVRKGRIQAHGRVPPPAAGVGGHLCRVDLRHPSGAKFAIDGPTPFPLFELHRSETVTDPLIEFPEDAGRIRRVDVRFPTAQIPPKFFNDSLHAPSPVSSGDGSYPVLHGGHDLGGHAVLHRPSRAFGASPLFPCGRSVSSVIWAFCLRGARPFRSPHRSALRASATTVSADFSLRVATSALQPQGEISPGKNAALPRTTAGFMPPRTRPRELCGHWPARPAGRRLLSGFCSSARGFAPRFLPAFGRPRAAALRFTRRGQLVGGLPPPRLRPCWAHHRKAQPSQVAPFLCRQG